jgi:Do/DeqQ family serine protease
MFNFLRRPAIARAGLGAALVAAVALAGYNVGLAHSPGAVVSASAAQAAPKPDAPRLKGSDPVTSYASIVDAVAPAVVTVRVEKRSQIMPTQFPQFPDDDLFRFFGRDLPRQQRIPRQSGLGSGVLTSADGYILTNNHVIDGADRVRVELIDKRVFDARVVGTDPASDLAVLKIDGSSLPAVSIGDSNGVRVGDVVLAIGNPLGIGQTVTMGIVSAKGRATGVGDGSYEDFLQTDAPINQGNSGGALINVNGELVGINSQILTPTGGNIGLGFAIPSNMAREVMSQLKEDGHVQRGKLGVSVQSMTSDLAASLKLSNTGGALVSGVEPGGAASRAGVKQGDVITAINGDKVADSNSLRNRIAATKPGSTIELEIVRNGKTETVRATLGELESRERAARGDQEPEGRGFGPTGMAVEPLTPQVARELGLSNRKAGVVVRDVNPDGAAASAGIQPGDVIIQVNGEAVKTPGELRAALTASGERPALLLITRENADIFLALRNPRS